MSAVGAPAAPSPPAPVGVRPAGRRPRRTLPVRVELARQLHRRRTQVVLVLLALLPPLVAAAFTLGDGGGTGSFVDTATSSGANFSLFCVFVTSTFLDTVLIALWFGDTVASEASWSSLRYLLALPVPRGRLLAVKATVAGLLSAVSLLLVPAVALGLGSLVYGTGPVATPFGSELAAGPAVGRIGLALGYLAVQLLWVAGLATLLSVSVDSPLGAVGATVLVDIVFSILNQITALAAVRPWLPANYVLGWVQLFSPTPDPAQMTWGVFTGLAYGTLLFGPGRAPGSPAATSPPEPGTRAGRHLPGPARPCRVSHRPCDMAREAGRAPRPPTTVVAYHEPDEHTD